ncbi:cytochrome c biogenesis protein ResB [Porphyromonas pogonae]|uniref:cytochrome c biogenesis protein ResB n=1 Tax=Porphyromonas pogonae TaxID=867595 RepID=UPI002E771D6E|nr:cytochrome c biogenesis protein ResB [Porphyromonas pogonae]
MLLFLVVLTDIFAHLRVKDPRNPGSTAEHRLRFPHLRFFGGQAATLTSIGGIIVVMLVMGLTKQIPTGMGAVMQHPFHRLGLSTILTTWYFLLLYLYLLFILGNVIARRVRRLQKGIRDFAFLLNHLGLFAALFFGLLAAADMQRYRMQVYTDAEYPEWRGIEETSNKMVELPVAIELKEFLLEEYPPKLMIIENKSGKALPLQRAEHLSIDHLPASGNIDGWHIEVTEHMPYSAAMVTKDSVVFKEFRTEGAAHSAKVMVYPLNNPAHKTSGWVSAGSYIFPYRSLKLTDSLSLVMAEPEPKQYSSDVVLYAQNGDIDKKNIQVNSPLRYKGWYIYQLNYDREKGRWSNMSEFELVRDPWLYGVYIGFGLLFAGAVFLFLGPLPQNTYHPKRKEHQS